MMHSLLSLTIWTPIVTGILVLLVARQDNLARGFALIGSIISLIFSILVFFHFDGSYSGVQFEESKPWISSLSLNYHLGIDGISLPFLVLNNFITLLVVLAGFKVIKYKVALYNSMFLLTAGFISGAFCAINAILFYVFFEAMLIPLYLIIGVWGGPNRTVAAIKFFLYTFFGSLMILIAFIYLYFVSGKTFNIFTYYHTQLTMVSQVGLFIAFFLAFAIKVPMFPLHTWLPDTYKEAPTGGTVVLSAVAVKLGGYGFLRFVLPILPDAARALAGVMVGLSLIAIVYFSLIALVQKDMKRMMAYSSVSHMGLVTLGSFLFVGTLLNPWAIEGALVQMVSHGLIAAGMFLCIGILSDRLGSTNMADYGGVVIKMPILAAFFMLFVMANVGLPGTSGFVGEFMVIMGAVQTKFSYAIVAATILVLGAAYTLWLYKKTILGEIANRHVAQLQDVNGYEFLILTLLGMAVIAVGVYPELLVAKMQTSVQDLIAEAATTKLG